MHRATLTLLVCAVIGLAAQRPDSLHAASSARVDRGTGVLAVRENAQAAWQIVELADRLPDVCALRSGGTGVRKVRLTGGEPLILAAEVWGDDGITAFATGLGCAVNINTNATLITPLVALMLVKVGTAKVHVSIDSADPEVQAAYLGTG